MRGQRSRTALFTGARAIQGQVRWKAAATTCSSPSPSFNRQTKTLSNPWPFRGSGGDPPGRWKLPRHFRSKLRFIYQLGIALILVERSVCYRQRFRRPWSRLVSLSISSVCRACCSVVDRSTLSILVNLSSGVTASPPRLLYVRTDD